MTDKWQSHQNSDYEPKAFKEYLFLDSLILMGRKVNRGHSKTPQYKELFQAKAGVIFCLQIQVLEIAPTTTIFLSLIIPGVSKTIPW